MNKKYKVEWVSVAQVDLKQIINYIAIKSPGNALHVLRKIRQSASSLYTFPERGRIIPELQSHGINVYRELIEGPWRIVYRITDTTVYVLSVIDSRQNVEDILLNRL
ncbi:type II toxin-antitoxin system RelE/ParE family toxin [Syntrophus gentianae]|uniref:type II toxin-antitoxin system RelE/ParE family toxin n=1 Tax=Syntrophus gentianae TaxID=43775 RepID=UPI000B89045C